MHARKVQCSTMTCLCIAIASLAMLVASISKESCSNCIKGSFKGFLKGSFKGSLKGSFKGSLKGSFMIPASSPNAASTLQGLVGRLGAQGRFGSEGFWV